MRAAQRTPARRNGARTPPPPTSADESASAAAAAMTTTTRKCIMYTAVMVCAVSVLVIAAPSLRTRLLVLSGAHATGTTTTTATNTHATTTHTRSNDSSNSNDNDHNSNNKSNSNRNSTVHNNKNTTQGDGNTHDATPHNTTAMTDANVTTQHNGTSSHDAAAPPHRQTVVVVGGGLAGCTAAIEAANCGAQVILLEKESRLGGNSAKATSGINGWGTPAQEAYGVNDSAELFERDTYRSGRGGNCDPGLVRMLSVKSADAIRWLTSLGVPLTVLSQLGGASRKRCHRAPDKSDGTPVPIGFTTLRILDAYIRTNLSSHVTVVTNARLVRLLHENHTLPTGEVATRVTGVVYERHAPPPTAANNATQGNNATTQQQQQAQRHVDANATHETVTLNADAVILATGGFSNDHTDNSLLREYAPQLAAFPTTNGAWATGDGVKMARELGVALVDMDKVQLHPTGFIDPKDPGNRTKYLGPEALRGSGGVLINKSGERFVNELDLRSVVSQAIIAQNNEYPGSGGSKFAYCVLNEAAATLFGKNALGFYWKRLGLFEKVNDVAELAQLIGCSEAALRNTLTQYEKVATEGALACPVTGKTVFPCVLGPQGPFYVAYITPSIHYTMGGCLISPSAEILSNRTRPSGGRLPILGLFGAGEVTGGVHGQNRLGGNSLLECVVFGKIAGRRAAQSALSPPTTFADTDADSPNAWVRMTVRAVTPEDGGGLVDDDDVNNTHAGAHVELNLPSALRRSGLALLQPVFLRRHDAQGRPSFACLLPSTPPDDVGVLGLHLPPPRRRALQWLYALQPGDEVDVRPGRAGTAICPPAQSTAPLATALARTRALYIVAAAPDGTAAALQLARAALLRPLRDRLAHVHLLYVADRAAELSARRALEACSGGGGDGVMTCRLLVDDPPPRWTGEVGTLDDEALRQFLPPTSAPRETLAQTTIVIAGGATAAATEYVTRHGYAKHAHVVILP